MIRELVEWASRPRTAGEVLWALTAAFLLIFYILPGLADLRWDMRTRRLGKVAPAEGRSLLPINVPRLLRVMQAFKDQRRLEFIKEQMLIHSNPNNPHTMRINLFSRRMILTTDPENMKAVLATQFQDFGKGPKFNMEWQAFLGDSIFTTDGELWHNSRNLLRPQFVKDRVSDLEIFDRHAKTLVDILANTKGAPVDISALFFAFALDASTDFLLGKTSNSLENPKDTFAEAFKEVQTRQMLNTVLGPLKVFISQKTFWSSLRTIDDFIQPFVDYTIGLQEDELEKGRYTFLHALARHTKDRKVLRDQIMAVLLAGRDTTACTLSWLFWELSTHPHVVTKLRQEIETHVGFERAPTYADLKSMRYLQATLNEALRLYPSVPVNVRVALKDTTLPRGGGPSGNEPIGVPKGSEVSYIPLIMQRRQDLYPVDQAPAEEFSPERWENWHPKAWTYIPFNGGPRICLGQQFALTEMSFTVVRLLQRFSRVECRQPGHQRPAMVTDIVVTPHNGVWVSLFEDEKA